MMNEQEHEPDAAADGASDTPGPVSAVSDPEADAVASDHAEEDLQTEIERIRSDAADAIRPGRPAST